MMERKRNPKERKYTYYILSCTAQKVWQRMRDREKRSEANGKRMCRWHLRQQLIEFCALKLIQFHNKICDVLLLLLLLYKQKHV